MLLLILYIVFVVICGAITVLTVVRFSIRRRGLLARSLNLKLFLVRFPHVQSLNGGGEQSLQQLREKIGLMEQFYSHFDTIYDSKWRIFLYGKPVVALELTVSSIEKEISFYIAVPRRFAQSVERVIQGIFPEASIEDAKDYNIFNPDGVTAASTVTLLNNSFYPIRTYQKLEGDPMKEITNVFTKLEELGEGAALQIVVRPASYKWVTRLKKDARDLMEGKQKEDPLFKIIQTAREVTGNNRSAQQEVPASKPKEPKKLTPEEEEKVRALEHKTAKYLFEANIRLVVSAKTRERAATILQGLEFAFTQFNEPSLNWLKVREVQGKEFKNTIFNFSFRSFNENKKIIINTEELTSIFHFPNVPLDTPHLKGIRAREAPPPANLPQAGLLLGYNSYRGEKSDIRFLDEDRRRHLYVIGQTGTGKSAFLKNLIVQDMREGKGVCVIDPHGDMTEDLLGFVPRVRAQDVIYFNPGDVQRPMGLNMLEYDPNYPEQKTFIVNELLSIFDKLYNMSVAGGPMFEQYFRNATMLVMDDPASGNTLLEIERVLTDKEFRDHKLSKSRNIVVKNFWTQIAEKAGGEASLKDMVPYIASKFDNFIANEIMRPIIAQEKSAFNFREVMDNQKILLVNLSKGRLGDLNSSLIGLIIVGKLLMAALSRTDTAEEKRKDFYFYIDEFQNVTTDSIATILSEARKYRLDLTITHQFIGQLKEEIKKAVFGNVGSMISFRIGSDDAEFMAKQYKPVFAEQDLLNIDNYNCYVKLLTNGASSVPFSMKTYPPEKGEREMAEVIKEISRTKYGRPREEVEQEIIDKHERPLF